MPSLVRILICCAWLGVGCALEGVPVGVMGIPGPPPVEGEDPIIGGAAVLIDAGGLAISLAEAIPVDLNEVTVVVTGGARRTARIERRGGRTGAVLLRVDLGGLTIAPLELASSERLQIGDTVWSLGNPFGSIDIDGRPVLSQGIVSGLYEISATSPPARGRGGVILSHYRGPIIETTAAVNDGNHGGALVDDSGALVGLCSLGVARERRMGTAVPLAAILADLGLPAAQRHPPPQDDPVLVALQTAAPAVAKGTVLVYFERPKGPGNPTGMPRPRDITETTPPYLRKSLQREWDRYYHVQQMFLTDQAVVAVVIDAAQGLLLTSASNLHGGAVRGRILDGQGDVEIWVKAVRPDLDLALLKTTKSLSGVTALPLANPPGLALADPVAILGRHRDGGAYTLTAGVVSAIRRNPPQLKQDIEFHQTDALANYGNLGGPVIDLEGHLVGLCVLLAPRPDWPWQINSGVALFIDSAQITAILPEMRANRVGLGVTLNDDLRIVGFVPGAGAVKAGLRFGDQVKQVADNAIGSIADLDHALQDHRAGERITLTVQRGDETLELPVELSEF